VTRKAQADYVAKLREGAKIERMDQAANTPGPLPDAAKPDAAKPDAAKDSKMAPAKK
jgi:peptidyl-prolyl cis-trans isomerase C